MTAGAVNCFKLGFPSRGIKNREVRENACSTQAMHDCIIKEASDASKSQNEPLTTEESARLTELEAEIENHGSAVGVALKEIHDKRLYRAEYRTWAEYCEKRWHRTRSWGYRLVDFERAKEQCRQTGDTPPKSEGRHRASKTKGTSAYKRNRTVFGPSKPSKIVNNLNDELESFKATVERWKNALSRADYLDLVNRVNLYTNTVLAVEQDEAEQPELEEIAHES